MATKLTKREKVLLYILTLVIIITGSVCLLILPGISKNADLAEEADTLRLQKMEMEGKISLLDHKKAKAEELQKQYDELCDGMFSIGMTEEVLDAYIVAIAAKCNVIPDILTIENSTFAAPKAFLSQDPGSSASEEKDNTDKSVYIVNVTIGGSAAMADFESLVNAYSKDSHIIVTSAYTTQASGGNNSYSITLQLYLLR